MNNRWVALLGQALVWLWLALMLWTIATAGMADTVFVDGFENRCEPFAELRLNSLPKVERNNTQVYRCSDFESCFGLGGTFRVDFSATTFISLPFTPPEGIHRVVWEDTVSGAEGWTVSYSTCEAGLLTPIPHCIRISGSSGGTLVSTTSPEPGVCVLSAGEPVWLNVAPWADGPTCSGFCQWLVAPRP